MKLQLKSSFPVGAIVTIFLGILSLLEAIRIYGYGRALLTGDHAFPGLIGIILIVSGILLFFGKSKNEEKATFPRGRILFNMISMLVILLFYCLLMPYLGYLICTSVSFIFLIKIIGGFRWLKTLLYAAIFTGALYYIFIVLLNTPLPSGILSL